MARPQQPLDAESSSCGSANAFGVDGCNREAVEPDRVGDAFDLGGTEWLRRCRQLCAGGDQLVRLQEAGEDPDWVYFPTRGIISVLTVLENGMMIEFATVGREGTTGVPIAVGLDHSNIALVSQMPGLAMRMRARHFRSEMERNGELAVAVRAYSGVMFALVAQSAACNRAHHVDERCARWLLMTHDQAGGNEFPVTQEFLEQMLGVSRPGVAASAAALQ
jgi:CRP-like cAMP-binding protein